MLPGILNQNDESCFHRTERRVGFWTGAFEFLIKQCGAVLPSLLGTLDMNRHRQSILSTCCDFCFAALPTFPVCSRCFCTLTNPPHCEWLPDGRCCNPGFLFGELPFSPKHDSIVSPCLSCPSTALPCAGAKHYGLCKADRGLSLLAFLHQISDVRTPKLLHP